MLLIVFTVALVAGTTQLSAVATLFSTASIGLRVSLGLALFALVFVGIAENARIPIDNPATRILAHPRGRISGSRGGVIADWDAIFARARFSAALWIAP